MTDEKNLGFKGFFRQLFSKIDKKLEQQSKDTPCCGGKKKSENETEQKKGKCCS